MFERFDPILAIPDFDEKSEMIRAIAPQGFTIALDVGWKGPKFWRSELNQEWCQVYREQYLHRSDPIVFWSTFSAGTVRWSQIPFRNSTNVMSRAAEFGMKYGAVICSENLNRRSFVSIAHGEREFTDAELKVTRVFLSMCMKEIAPKVELSAKEIAVLELLKRGYAQAEIGRELKIAESTVKQRCGTFMTKLNARTRTQAVARALELNLLD